MKEWRLHRGLTQQDVADALNTSKGYVSELERGVRRYNQDTLEALARTFTCQPSDILAVNPDDPASAISTIGILTTLLGPGGVKEVENFIEFKISQNSETSKRT